MDKKLLFFDIDGTLLAGGIPGYIPQSATEALIQAQKNGHYIFINSGRTFAFMPDLIKEFPFDGYVCGCGTEILLHGQSLYHYEIPKELRFGMEDILHKTNLQAVYEGRSACYFEKREDSFPPIISIKNAYANAKIEQPIRYFDDPELDFDKFVILFDKNSNLPLFRSLIQDDFDFIGREDMTPYGFAEIIPKGCSKASGIDFIVEYLHLSLDDCYVFGDSTNDLSMLRHVKNSVAMGNAFPEVLRETSYVTTPVDRDGIWVALKHFHLI